MLADVAAVQVQGVRRTVELVEIAGQQFVDSGVGSGVCWTSLVNRSWTASASRQAFGPALTTTLAGQRVDAGVDRHPQRTAG